MKKLFFTLLMLPAMAFAGPNWSVVRSGHQHQPQAQDEEVMPLDHGPRAMSTPWLNKEQELFLGQHKEHGKKH